MWVKRLFILLAALGLCAASAWFFVQSGDRALHAPAPDAFMPADLAAFTHVQEPFTLAEHMRSTPVYQSVHPQLNWFTVLCPKGKERHDWYFENGAYLLTQRDTAALIFGLPDRWRQQESEAWLTTYLGARPVRSGLLRLNDTLFAHLSQEAVCVSTGDQPPVFFRAKARDENAQLLKALSHAGAATFSQFSHGGELSLPFMPVHSTSRTIRDVYFEAEGIIAEEVITPDSAYITEQKLPAAWQTLLPANLLRFDGIALPEPKLTSDQMRAALLMAEDSASTERRNAGHAAFNGRLADLETASGISASVLLEDWWTTGIAAIETASASYLMLANGDASIALGSLRSYLTPKETRLSDGIVLSWETPELLQHLLSPFTKLKVGAAWINDKTVIFAETEQALIRLVTEIATGQTLSNEHLLVRALDRGESFIRYHHGDLDWSSKNPEMHLPALTGEEGAAPHFIYSGVPMRDGRIVTRLELQTSSEARSSIKLKWESTRPGLLGQRLWSARNHHTNGFYILLQDSNHTLHAIDANGREMWKLALNGPVMGELHEVDIYRNGKVQVAFGTAGALHMVAVNGQYVEGYPIKFKAGIQATSPLYVADYDRQRNYRLLVGTSDGKLRNYRNEAEVTPGWNYKSGQQTIVQVEHLKTGNKDYLFALFDDGSVKLLERDGTPRYETPVNLSDITPPVQFRLTGDIRTSTAIGINTAMQVLEYTFGAKENTAPAVLGKGSTFVLADLDGDRLTDFALADSTRVEAYTADKTLMFEREFLDPVAPELYTYTFSTGKKVGVSVPALGQIHLLESDGSSSEGFPLFGNSRFVIRDLDGDGKLELVTTDGEGLVLCYEL